MMGVDEVGITDMKRGDVLEEWKTDAVDDEIIKGAVLVAMVISIDDDWSGSIVKEEEVIIDEERSVAAIIKINRSSFY